MRPGDFMVKLKYIGGCWEDGATHIMRDGKTTLCGKTPSADWDDATFEDFDCGSCKKVVKKVMRELPSWMSNMVNNFFTLLDLI